MATFQTKANLPAADQAEIDRIVAISSGQRTTKEAAYLTARDPYLYNEVNAYDAAGNILEAGGHTLPTGYAGFAKSAKFRKTDVASGTQALYENVGDTDAAVWNCIGLQNEDDPLLPSGNIFNDGTPVNAVASQGTLDITGDGADGETVTIGTRVYELDTNDGTDVTPGRVAVDVSGGSTVKSQGTLTVDTNPIADDDTMTIGDVVYTFRANGTTPLAEGDIELGTGGSALADTQTAIIAAINGTDGHNTANPYVTCGAFASDDAVLTAIAGGTAGDAIATTETFTAGTNVFDDVTLGTTTAGVDPTASEIVTALVTAITGDGSAVVTAADGTGDTVVVTAKVKGTSGDAIAFATTMANATVDDATLGTTTAGVDGTVGSLGDLYRDENYIYVATDDNTVADANWKRSALSSF